MSKIVATSYIKIFLFADVHTNMYVCVSISAITFISTFVRVYAYTLYYSRISLYLYAYNIRASRFSNTEMRIPPPFDIYMYTFTHSRTVFLLCVGGAPVPCAESVDGERGEREGGGGIERVTGGCASL